MMSWQSGTRSRLYKNARRILPDGWTGQLALGIGEGNGRAETSRIRVASTKPEKKPSAYGPP